MKKLCNNTSKAFYTLKKTVTRVFSIAFLSSSSFFLPNSINASPSESYKTQTDCWKRPDFITSQDFSYRYCLRANGAIEKINIEGEKDTGMHFDLTEFYFENRNNK